MKPSRSAFADQPVSAIAPSDVLPSAWSMTTTGRSVLASAPGGAWSTYVRRTVSWRIVYRVSEAGC